MQCNVEDKLKSTWNRIVSQVQCKASGAEWAQRAWYEMEMKQGYNEQKVKVGGGWKVYLERRALL